MTHQKKIAACFVFALLALAALPTVAATGTVNINSADAEELALLPRVGSVVASRIIEFRDKNGRFTDAEDLMLVEGIGEKTFGLIEPWVSIDGETTLTEKVKVPRAASAEEAE
ncbi:MAG: helix-hairpin-helix domain-containing protein [Acidobacteriota bacterium]|nr:helix-hairpin-helix domain-containing protein [Acidobacteriota bacterium]